MTRDFFSLEGTPNDIPDQASFLGLVKARGQAVKNIIYRPDSLESPVQPRRWRIREIDFENVSFSKTTIDAIDFSDCTFSKCLFLGTMFVRCRFTNCRFIDCNPYRIEFSSTHIDPRSFDSCLPRRKYENIGVHLYQELLRNSRELAQPDFSDYAHYHFRRWQRYLLSRDIAESTVGFKEHLARYINISRSWCFEKTTGSGVRLRNFAATTASVVFCLSLINWCFRVQFGLHYNGATIQSAFDALYFSVITITTLGFGDITPTTILGRLFISLEAIIGFVLLALLSSMIYRRVST